MYVCECVYVCEKRNNYVFMYEMSNISKNTRFFVFSDVYFSMHCIMDIYKHVMN